MLDKDKIIGLILLLAGVISAFLYAFFGISWWLDYESDGFRLCLIIIYHILSIVAGFCMLVIGDLTNE
jgi:hypothetical protein